MKFCVKDQIVVISILCFSNYQLTAQSFKISCDTADISYRANPFIGMCENLFDEACNGIRIEMKNSSKSFETSIGIQKPIFIQLINTELIAIPNQSVKGVLQHNGDIFLINDNNNINSLLVEFRKRASGITAQYNGSSTFTRFLQLYDSLHQYINSIVNYISTITAKKKYNINDEILSAIKQYCMAKLAHFTVLPILYRANYDEQLFALIKRDVKINNPTYWLQIQPGRIFLKNYFLKVVLPKNKYDFHKTLASDILFNDTEIKKYLQYHYFNWLLSRDTAVNNLAANIKEFIDYENKYHFTTEEHKILQQLKTKFDLTGKNIIPLFSRQLLVNNKGEILGDEKNDLLKNKGKVIIDYWASWCLPCIETISTLKSDEITYKGEKYKIIFISKDENQQQWLNKKYLVLNSGNSFRLSDFTSPSFYKTFQIDAIPRLFLIDNGILINQNLSKETFHQMLKD